jgi:hypothetical protein
MKPLIALVGLLFHFVAFHNLCWQLDWCTLGRLPRGCHPSGQSQTCASTVTPRTLYRAPCPPRSNKRKARADCALTHSTLR